MQDVLLELEVDGGLIRGNARCLPFVADHPRRERDFAVGDTKAIFAPCVGASADGDADDADGRIGDGLAGAEDGDTTGHFTLRRHHWRDHQQGCGGAEESSEHTTS